MKKDCPICGTIVYKNLEAYPFLTNFNNKVFKYLKCNNCKSIYLKNNLADEDLRLMYNPSYHDSFYNDNYKTIIQFLKNLLET